MEKITLAGVTLQKEPGGLRITSIKTGGTVLISLDVLERWALRVLRANT